MRLITGISASVLLLGATMAAAQDVRYNFDKESDFSRFKTYAWVEMKSAPKVSSIVDNQIKSTVDAELAKKGLTKASQDSADVLIGYQAGVAQEKQLTSYDAGWGYGPGWRGGWYGAGGGMSTSSTSTINIGQLALDMYDAKGHTLVWRGVVSKTLDENAKPDKQQKNLTKSVTKLLKDYPPKVKS
jgi:hypothetical protein